MFEKEFHFVNFIFILQINENKFPSEFEFALCQNEIKQKQYQQCKC